MATVAFQSFGGAASSPGALAQGAGADAAKYLYTATWPLPQAPAEPVDLASVAGGKLLVADGREHAVLVYGADGYLVDRWPDPPTGALTGYVYVPRALTYDIDREVSYILWQRFSDDDGLLVPGGYYLDPRNDDGTSARPLQALTFLSVATDMAVDPASGDIFFLTGDSVTRLTVPGGVPVYGFVVGSGAGRLAVSRDGKVWVTREALRRIERYEPDGEFVGAVELAPLAPLDVTIDDTADVLVIVRDTEPADPDAVVVLRTNSRGATSTEVVADDLGAPVPPNGSWPWSITWGRDSAAITSGSSRFGVFRFNDGEPIGAPLEGGPLRDSHEVTLPDPMLVGAGVALETTSDGGLAALDSRAAQVYRFDKTGAAKFDTSVPEHAVDLAVDESDTIYISTSDGWLHRLANYPQDAQGWTIPCECGLGGRLTVSDDMLYVSRPRHQKVSALQRDSGIFSHDLRMSDAVGLWPADVEADHEARLFSADLVTARVHAWSGSDAPEAAWQTGLLSGPRRVAAGRLADGSTVVASAMADGFVELHAGVDGNMFGRWLPRLGDGLSPDLSDIAVGSDGEVYLADARARAVHVFEPAGGIPPTDEPAPGPSPTPSDLACDVRGDKLAAPSTVVLGSGASVTLTLSADCPARTRLTGADIVLVMDRSGSMKGAKMAAAQGAARAFAEMLDVRYHRLGLVSFSSEATVDVPLTESVPTVIDGLVALQAEGGTNIAAALERARDNLSTFGRARALPVIVLLSDGRNQEQQPDPRGAAAEARSWGAQVYTIGLGSDVDGSLLGELAGRADRYHAAPTPSELYPIYGQILREVVSSLAGNLVIDDELADNLRYVSGSARPLALESPSRLRWGRSILPSSGLTLTYEIRPKAVGCVPVSKRALAEYTDGDGVRRTYEFPVPTICAIAGSQTPSPPPTATRQPSPTPTALVRDESVYLPVAFRDACLPGKVHADVVLLIDTSSSMTDAKLTAAKIAAGLFVDQLRFPLDQAAVIGFDASARRAVGLSVDRDAVKRAIDGLQVGQGTRIDRALNEALLVLLDPGHRPGNRPVIVLLSDGGHGGDRNDVLNAAADARDLGALVFTIGLGTDVDRGLLASVSGDRRRAFFAPTERDLAAIYRQIAVTIPCR